MYRIRSVVFWIHLAAGVAAGVVIFVMSVTGALLALKPQILNVLESDVRTVDPSGRPAQRLGVQALLAPVTAARPQAQINSVTLQRDPTASAAVVFGRDDTVYVDPYTGRVLGAGSRRAQSFFRTVEDWHRWLGASGERRVAARAATGACNAAFLLLALTGPFLWWPRSWGRSNVRAVVWFRRARTGRARDFNWHNVIGLWCSPVIVVLTLTGVVMSYPWANALLYRLAGSAPPIAGGGGGQAQDGGRRASIPVNLDQVWGRATDQVPSWRSMTMRLPARASAPVTVSIVDGRSWNQFARSQLTVDAVTAAPVKWEPYDDTSRGQKIRGWFRFAHTGELGGWITQSVAGLASAGGGVLAWTGLALACRRLMRWTLWTRLAKLRSSSPPVGVSGVSPQSTVDSSQTTSSVGS